MTTYRLAAWVENPRSVSDLRELTSDEVKLHSIYTPIVVEARNRLRLFKILAKNYDEWSAYIKRLLSADDIEHDDVQDELNRLILNYLTFAYTIREHFEVSYRQRFKKDVKKLEKYEAFIDRLCDKSWAFAFFSDFRGYVQHRGLAVGRFNRRVSRTQVQIEVAADASQLLSESREWKRSKLAPVRGTIDLVECLSEFQSQMLQNYALFVANMFFPELMPASDFYRRLADEVRANYPTATMIFLEGNAVAGSVDGKRTVKLKMALVPNDVFSELGIKVMQKANEGL